jgi:hypothetical protein
MAESYADEQRRRNGLPPAGYYVDECTVVEVDGMPVAVRGSGQITERDREMFAEVVQAAKRRFEAEQPPDRTVTVTADTTGAERALDRLAAAFDLRCLHDLLPDMCHHCKETDRV